MAFEETNACWLLSDYTDFERAIEEIKKKSRVCPYGKPNVDQFIQNEVYGGIKDRDVLGDYVSFIVSKGQEIHLKISA